MSLKIFWTVLEFSAFFANSDSQVWQCRTLVIILSFSIVLLFNVFRFSFTMNIQSRFIHSGRTWKSENTPEKCFGLKSYEKNP